MHEQLPRTQLGPRSRKRAEAEPVGSGVNTLVALVVGLSVLVPALRFPPMLPERDIPLRIFIVQTPAKTELAIFLCHLGQGNQGNIGGDVIGIVPTR